MTSWMTTKHWMGHQRSTFFWPLRAPYSNDVICIMYINFIKQSDSNSRELLVRVTLKTKAGSYLFFLFLLIGANIRPCPKRRLRLQLRLDQRVYQCWRIGRRARSSRSCSRSRRFGHGLSHCHYLGLVPCLTWAKWTVIHKGAMVSLWRGYVPLV